jgi:hypothetical protein
VAGTAGKDMLAALADTRHAKHAEYTKALNEYQALPESERMKLVDVTPLVEKLQKQANGTVIEGRTSAQKNLDEIMKLVPKTEEAGTDPLLAVREAQVNKFVADNISPTSPNRAAQIASLRQQFGLPATEDPALAKTVMAGTPESGRVMIPYEKLNDVKKNLQDAAEFNSERIQRKAPEVELGKAASMAKELVDQGPLKKANALYHELVDYDSNARQALGLRAEHGVPAIEGMGLGLKLSRMGINQVTTGLRSPDWDAVVEKYPELKEPLKTTKAFVAKDLLTARAFPQKTGVIPQTNAALRDMAFSGQSYLGAKAAGMDPQHAALVSTGLKLLAQGAAPFWGRVALPIAREGGRIAGALNTPTARTLQQAAGGQAGAGMMPIMMAGPEYLQMILARRSQAQQDAEDNRRLPPPAPEK